MSYEVHVLVAPPLPGGLTSINGRRLARREARTLREARRWVAINSETWRSALTATETHFTAFVLDEDHEPVLVIEQSSNWADSPLEYDRAALREFTKTTTYAKEESA